MRYEITPEMIGKARRVGYMEVAIEHGNTMAEAREIGNHISKVLDDESRQDSKMRTRQGEYRKLAVRDRCVKLP